MRARTAVLLLLASACGSQQATLAALDGGTDATTSDASLEASAPDTGATGEGGADSAAGDARSDATDASDGHASPCTGLDAATILVCESFDESATLPAPFDASLDIAATVDISAQRALSPPHSAHVALGDASDFNSATGAVARAVFASPLPRARLAYAIYLDGTFNGEVDVSALVWQDSTTFYRLRFGTNGGTFWMFDSGGTGYASQSPFPPGAWYRVTIDVDLVAKHSSIVVGGVKVFDNIPISSPTFTATSIELDLGVAAIASGAAGTSPGVFIDDVVLSSF